MIKKQFYLPKPYGLYHPKNEKENCGVGFIANIKSKASYKITEDALEMLSRMGPVSYTHLTLPTKRIV